MARGKDFYDISWGFTNDLDIGITLPAGKVPYGNFKICSKTGNHYWQVYANCENYTLLRYGVYLDDYSGHSVKVMTLTFNNPDRHGMTGWNQTSTATIDRANTVNFVGKLKVRAECEIGPGKKFLELNSAVLWFEVDIGDPVLPVTVNAGTGGSCTANVASAAPGATVTLQPVPATGYQLSGYTSNPAVQIIGNRFTMPSSAITVTASFTKITYSVTVKSATGGSCTASRSTAQMGDTVTLAATPQTGYQLSGYTITPSVTVTNNSFTMPAGNVTITPVFTKIQYTVTVAAGTGGTLKASSAQAAYGDTVALTPTPDTGYQLSGYTSSPPLTITNNRFVMPAGNVTVTATFSKIGYTITSAANPEEGGTVTISRGRSMETVANYGDAITVNQTPNTGYAFKSWTTSPAGLISGSGFTMPAKNVAVTANYYQLSTPRLNKTSMDGGSTVTMTITTESAEYSHKYRLSFGTGMETELTSVAAGVTSVNISVPLEWSAQIPNDTSKSQGTLLLETYVGSTKIGERTISGLTYTVPATVKPTIGTITTSIERTIDNVTYPNIGDYYVQNHSGVRVQTTASGAQSSTITQLTVSIGGYSGNKFNTTVQTGSIDFTSGLLPTAGALTISVSVTDSRGRTNMATATITVSEYRKPAGSLDVYRVDADGVRDDMGTYGKYELNKSYTQLGSNALTWTLSYSGGSASSPADTGDLLPGDRKTFAQTNEYLFTLTLTDSMGETTVITDKLPSARFIFACDSSGNRIGIMKFPSENIPSGKARTLEISADTQIYIGSMTLEDYIQSLI